MVCMRIGSAKIIMIVNIFKHNGHYASLVFIVIWPSADISPAGVIYAARVIHCSCKLSAVRNDK